jgi:hypothetical protein
MINEKHEQEVQKHMKEHNIGLKVCSSGCTHIQQPEKEVTINNSTTDTVKYKNFEEFQDKTQLAYTASLQYIQPSEIVFNIQDNEAIGKLFKKDGLLCFEGDLDKSAEVLFKYVCEMFNKN